MSNVPPAANFRGAVDLSSLVRAQQQAPQETTGGAVDVPSLVVDGTDANFGNILELSKTVPVIVELYAGEPTPSLIALIKEYAGRFLLATVDAQANPQLVQAFQAVAAPTVAALIGGRPVGLYEGELPDADARRVFDQLTQVAAQNGVTGTVRASGEEAQPDAEPAEEPLPPLHQEAYDAILTGDYDAAITAYRTAMAQNPRDALAVAGLAQVSLLKRLDGVVADDVRRAAADAPQDVDAALAVADLDVSGGHLEDAFGRLLDLFGSLGGDDRDRVRTRLLDYFEIAGAEDPRVIAARKRLTMLLY